MQIQLIAVGKLKEKYLQQAVEEYKKRLTAYCRLETIEVADEATIEEASPAQEQQIKAKEAARLAKALSDDVFCVALAIEGKNFSSEGLARVIEEKGLQGQSKISFLIGGSMGLAPYLLARADLLLSLSTLTFPHQMARLILLEQVYRCFKIIRREPYHK
ncbi:MAG TPA: 23S rRNA (pseudouridine(1915)-N(3))-methyltransferase RlmH [Cyanobacteria bacterium UBA8530]|nr:23S rRNA (pseudouridine(1915)-N(3))-methyltransferase RlmH [Cyanobacteria bacterium UBA8530]